MGRLDGKVCIVTGASSGIGAKTCEVFAKEGAKVVMAARRGDVMQQVAGKIMAAGGDVYPVVTDITVTEQVDNLVAKAIEKYGRIDVLINDAGILDMGLKPIEEFEDADLDDIVTTNLKGTMYVTRAVTKVFDQQGTGNIVSVASIAGVLGNGSAVYSASKGAVIAMTKHIALRYAYKKPYIRANCICPGTVWTPMTQASLAAQKDYTKGANELNTSIGMHSTQEVGICKTIDVANLLLFLASDESICINGEAINIDCGCTL